MRRSLVALLIVLASLPQAASSATSEGEFVVAAEVLLPTGSRLEGALHAWFMPDTTRLETLSLVTSKAKIQHHVRELVALGRGDRVERGHHVSTYDLTDVEITLTEGEASGEMGFHPQIGLIDVVVSEAVVARPRLSGTYSNYEGSTLESDAMRDGRYRKTVLNPHFDLEFDGRSTFKGAGTAVLFGPDVTIRARENTLGFNTGESAESGALVWTIRQEWITIDFVDGAFEARGSQGAFRSAVADLDVAWREMAVFVPLAGVLRAGGQEFRAEGRPIYVSGDFVGTLNIRSLQDEHAVLFNFQGDLWSTSLKPQAVSVSAETGSWPFLLALAGLGGAGSLAGLALLRRRRLRRPREQPIVGSPEAYLAAANRAAAEEDWEEALDWIRKGRTLAPTSVKLRLDEAFFLSMLGRIPEAFRIYEEAAALATDGEAAFSAAVCAAQHGLPAAEAERWLLVALDRSPELALEVSDLCFKEIIERPRIREALEIAAERLRGGSEPTS
ncbi:MAG TPA: hypothetical protein VM889_10395 [Candidatus Thermoplasmatota archaeon]|nr:hypothetical protein [Candidatus Thermoplasmatota archaeon]